MYYDIWDTILVEYWFTDFSDKKIRPALIIWQYKEDYIVLAISSKESNWLNFEIYERHLSEWKLLIRSYIKINNISTLHYSVITKKIAKMKSEVVSNVIEKFNKEILG